VFTSRNLAEEWIKRHSLSGTLTRYPLDISVYDWAITRNLFEPKKDEHRKPEFVGRFSSASQEHYHFETGSPG